MKDVENLTEDNDWVSIINNWLGEEESNIDPEFDPLEDEGIKEIEERWRQNQGENAEKKKKGNSKGGKTKGKKNAAKQITIRDINTGKIKVFESKSECMKYLGVGSKETFSRFIKGNTRLNKLYSIEM